MQAAANDFWAVLRDYAAPPPAAVLTQQVQNIGSYRIKYISISGRCSH